MAPIGRILGHHQGAARFAGQRDEPPPLRRIHGDGFLQQYVQPRIQGSASVLEMQVVGGADDDAVHRAAANQLGVVGIGVGHGKGPRHLR